MFDRFFLLQGTKFSSIYPYIFDSVKTTHRCVLGSIVVSIPACHAGDRGSIPRRGGYFFEFVVLLQQTILVLFVTNKIEQAQNLSFLWLKLFSLFLILGCCRDSLASKCIGESLGCKYCMAHRLHQPYAGNSITSTRMWLARSMYISNAPRRHTAEWRSGSVLGP